MSIAVCPRVEADDKHMVVGVEGVAFADVEHSRRRRYAWILEPRATGVTSG
jgi:hypothetical protein